MFPRTIVLIRLEPSQFFQHGTRGEWALPQPTFLPLSFDDIPLLTIAARSRIVSRGQRFLKPPCRYIAR
jgi:hypothetical protein